MTSFKLLSAIFALSCVLQVSQCLGSDLVGICAPLTESKQKALPHSLKEVAGLGAALVVVKVLDLILECKDYLGRPRQTKAMEDYWNVTNRYNAAMRERREAAAGL